MDFCAQSAFGILMIFWLSIALLTVLITGLLIYWMSSTPESIANTQTSAGSDLAIYKSQMVEIDRELGSGQLDEHGAKEARLELARRVLSAEAELKKPTGGKGRSRFFRIITGCAVLLVPLFTWGLYDWLGSAGKPAYPFARLLAKDPQLLSAGERLVRLEVSVNRAQDDGPFLDELAELYLTAGRYRDAANTLNRSIAKNGETAFRLTRFGIALTGLDDGVVTTEAEEAFRKAVEIDPESPDPQVFLARGLIQAGKVDEAVLRLQSFIDSVPQDKPWRKDIVAVVAKLKNAQASSREAQSSERTVTARQADFISANLDKLVAHVADSPEDIQGWTMLINAYRLLDRPVEAKAAYNNALKKLPPEKAARLRTHMEPDYEDKGVSNGKGIAP